MKKILFIIGSLRKDSFNLQLAKEVEGMIKDKADVSYLNYSNIPFMNQDIEVPEHDEIKRVRDAVRNTDAIWIFSPEYNYSYPGVLKNLIDWLSRPVEAGNYDTVVVKNVKVTVSNVAGQSTGAGSREKLLELLGKVGMKVMDSELTGVALPKDSWISGKLILSRENSEQLKRQIDAFLKFI